MDVLLFISSPFFISVVSGFLRFGAICTWTIRLCICEEAKRTHCALANFILICFMRVCKYWEFSNNILKGTYYVLDLL